MKKLSVLLLLVAINSFVFAQSLDKVIKQKEVTKIVTTLASDDMQGRGAFSPGLEKAAAYIARYFKKIGLKQIDGATKYRLPFTLLKPTTISTTGNVGSEQLTAKQVVLFTTQPNVHIDQNSGYAKAYIKKGASYGMEVSRLVRSKENTVVFVDTSFAARFTRINTLKQYLKLSQANVAFVLAAGEPTEFTVDVAHKIDTLTGYNIVGVLPGRSKKEEEVIFSGHYDHLGYGKLTNGDSIYNGANDNASGVTGMMMAAKYFKKARNNERTLVFVAFAAEELGTLGSEFFSAKMDADKVKAMLNLEMIGTESKWGKNSAYITGFKETNMGEILQKNLQGTGFEFHPDPYTAQDLFYRSDNASLARRGVPAHTISTSKMDVEPNYHKLTDELKTLDLDNMTAIIKAIIKSSASIVSGADTPTRVNSAGMRR